MRNLNIQLQAKLARSLNKRSHDPRSPENASDPDWQAGYMIGCCHEESLELRDDRHPITAEWRRRLCPNRATPEFTSWKAGYWAGVFRMLVISEQ
jgi:hypothetical protein